MFNQHDFLITLRELIDITFEENINLNSIILVGSNYNMFKKEFLVSSKSDIDVIILTNSNSFYINQLYKNIRFDVSIINQDDIIKIFLGALNGSSFFGKIVTSLNQFEIIKDIDEIGITFINTIKYFYESFTKSFLPNYSVNSIYIHNILANKKDLKKETKEESFFALQRLSEHLFNYISFLIYPFQTSGSYRAKVIGQYLNQKNSKEKKNIVLNKKLIISILSNICPVLEYEFRAVEYNKKIETLILEHKISSFYFGYKELLSENTIIFLLEKDVIKNKLKLQKITNIIPFLTKNEMIMFTNFLVLLSKKNMTSSVNEKKEFLISIYNEFKHMKLGHVIDDSLKNILILKTLKEVKKQDTKINIKKFNNWLMNIKGMSLSNNNMQKQIRFQEIIAFIENSSDKIEKEIKTIHIFFAIMKSLRIEIEDLNFTDEI